MKSEMINKGITEEKESAKYLLEYIEDIGKKGIDSVQLGPLKTAAAGAIVKKHSDATLSSLVSEFDTQFKKELPDSKGFLTERHNILRRKIGILKKILKEKKEEEDKKAKIQEEKSADR